MTFIASCNNCHNFVDGRCSLGISLAPGKLLCERYAITASFRDQIVEVMLADVWKQVQVNTDKVRKLQAARRLWN